MSAKDKSNKIPMSHILSSGGDGKAQIIPSIGAYVIDLSAETPTIEPKEFSDRTIRNEVLDETVAAIREHMIGVFDPDQVRLTEDLIVEIEKLKKPASLVPNGTPILIKDEEWRSTTHMEDSSDRGTPFGFERE